jgi:hypothetical protein
MACRSNLQILFRNNRLDWRRSKLHRRHRLKRRGCLPRSAAPANIGERSTGLASVPGKLSLEAFLPWLARWTATFPIPATTAVHPQRSEEDLQRATPAPVLSRGLPSNRVPPSVAFASEVRSDREERPSQTDVAPFRAPTAYSPWSNEPRRCLTLLFPLLLSRSGLDIQASWPDVASWA